MRIMCIFSCLKNFKHLQFGASHFSSFNEKIYGFLWKQRKTVGNRISIKKNQRNETNQNEVQNELFPDDTYNPKNRLVEQNLKNQFSMTVK